MEITKLYFSVGPPMCELCNVHCAVSEAGASNRPEPRSSSKAPRTCNKPELKVGGRDTYKNCNQLST